MIRDTSPESTPGATCLPENSVNATASSLEKPSVLAHSPEEAMIPRPEERPRMDTPVCEFNIAHAGSSGSPDIDYSLHLSLTDDLFKAVPQIPESDDPDIEPGLQATQASFDCGNYAHARAFAQGLFETLGEKATPELLTYLDKMHLFCTLNLKETGVVFARLTDLLPIHNEDDFIQWHLAIAEAYAKGSPCLPVKNKLNQLCCYRRAADAGSVEARVAVLKEVLFSNPAEEVPFISAEVLSHLQVLAKCDEYLDSSVKKSPDEITIHQMVQLIRSNDDAEKRKLAEQLCLDHRCKGRLLAPWLYMKPEFGVVDTKEAKRLLRLIEAGSHDFDGKSDGKSKTYFEQMCKLHSIELGLIAHDPGAEGQLAELTKECFPPALQMAVTRHIEAQEWEAAQSLCIHWVKNKELVLSPHPVFALLQYCATLYGAIADCKKVIADPLSDDYGREVRHRVLEKAMALAEVLRTVNIEHCNPDGRALHIMESLEDVLKTLPKHYRDVSAGKANALPESFADSMDWCRYSQDPQVLVFRHFEQTLNGDTPDEELITRALVKDRFGTLYRMVALDHCCKTLNSQKVLSEFIECLKADFELLRRFQCDVGLVHVYDRLKDEFESVDSPLVALYVAEAIARTKKLPPKNVGRVLQTIE